MFKVFIVEDDPMVLNINKKFVEKLSNFKVIETSKRGKESSSKIIEMKPDLVLLDFFMPEQNGLELLKEIRSSTTHPEVIMITAAQDIETVTEALRLGVLDYIVKPYGFNRLKQALDIFALKMNTLKDNTTLTQNEIDHMKFSLKITRDEASTSRDHDLPKGLDEITLDKIKKAVHKNKQPMSSNDMALILNLSRITVRKYLEYLVDIGTLKVQLQYGGSGRPTKLYYGSKNPDNK